MFFNYLIPFFFQLTMLLSSYCMCGAVTFCLVLVRITELIEIQTNEGRIYCRADVLGSIGTGFMSLGGAILTLSQ